MREITIMNDQQAGKRKIVYLINPISGTEGKHLLKETIARETKKSGIAFEIHNTDITGNYQSLVEQVRDNKVTDVIVCGGDGSINGVASALIGTAVSIGIVPMGSGNGLAYTAKIPRNTVKALEIIFKGRSSYIDSFYINEQFSCMLCGIGFDAGVAHDFAKEKKRGLKTYMQVTAINFMSAKPYVFEIHAGERAVVTEAFFISIANSNQFGNNFTIAPEASLNDGLLDIVIVKKMNKLLLPLSVLSQIRGINAKQDFIDSPGTKNIIYFQTSTLSIINTNNAPLHIDGDPKTTSARFDIKLIPRAIKLLQP